MNIIGWLLAGALIAWMGRSIIHTGAQMGSLLNVIIGVIAAGLAGWVLSPLVGGSTISAFRTRWRERPRERIWLARQRPRCGRSHF